MPHADTTTDGRRDFDFLYGDWLIHNRKLVNSADPDCAEWIEFEATGSAHPILDGLGNMDSFTVLDGPGDMAGLEGASLRLYDTARGLWRIWWMSNRVPGQLDPPVEGRWVDGEGEFVCDDVLAGRPITVRFHWSVLGADSARWTQEFSFDGRATWQLNWVMEFTRAAVLQDAR